MARRPIPPASTQQDLIGQAEAAELVGVHAKTIRRYVAEGRLTAYRVGPRLLRVDRREVLGLLKPVPTGNSAA